eukprot:m.326994 g.326994  ORF g.326994 m.326994 type:complete len:684 (-) comp16564_c1_seq3:379-2430(-)
MMTQMQWVCRAYGQLRSAHIHSPRVLMRFASQRPGPLPSASFMKSLHVCGRRLLKQANRTHVTAALLSGSLVWRFHGCSVHLEQSKKVGTVELESESHITKKRKRLRVDWAWLWSLLKPDALYFAGSIIAATLAAMINLKLTAYLGEFINEIVSKTDMKATAITVLSMAGTQAALTALYISLLAAAGERLCERLRNTLYESVLRQDLGFFDQHKTGEILDRLSSDVDAFKSSFKRCVWQGLRNVTQALGSVIAMLTISRELGLSVIISVPVIITFGTYLGKHLRKMSLTAKEAVANGISHANEIVGNIRTIRAFATEDEETEKFAKFSAVARSLSIQLGIGIGLFQGLSHLFSHAVILSVLYFGGSQNSGMGLTAGELMRFFISAQTLQHSFAGFSLLLDTAIRGIEAASRIQEYVQLQPSIPTHGGIRIDNVQGTLKFNNVTFAYPGRDDEKVLRSFSFEIPAGKVVALCGPSGAGKSTIAGLIERFYDPTQGRVTLDGMDLKKVDPHWLRKDIIGYINQEPVLFSGSILENIRYGVPNASFEDVVRAAKEANAHTFISSFPDGYETVLGERGVTVSGGQRQRIAIARALLKDPKILILDEATSALDSESERLVQDAINRITNGRTVVVIAHRLSTIKDADIVAVLKQGEVVEQGTHNELLNMNGLYANLVRHQMNEDNTQS